jgi:DNA (cytosine-5)-methyltransferase 1
MEMKYFSAFTGVGGFDLGMPLDWECVGHSEINKYANMVLRYRFKGVKNYGDIQKIKWSEVPDFDMLVGGTPCQDLSVAGKRTGINGSRSRLFFEFIRVLKEKKPKYFIWENVKGIISSNGGWDFAKVLLEFSEAGYSVWWQVLDATWFGIPQHRERVFVVGYLGREPPLKILFEPNHAGSSIDSKTGGHQGIKIAIPILSPNRMKKKQNGRRFKDNGEPSFTLTQQDRHGIFDGKIIRMLTPRECERLMGWSDDWTRWGIDEKGNIVELSDTQRYNLIGNGVVPQIISNIIKNIDYPKYTVNIENKEG